MKLNRKGYMTIEIILAAVVTFVIAFFLIDITMKLSSNTDDVYADTVLITDKTLITKNIKENLENDICENGVITNVECYDGVVEFGNRYCYCRIFFDNGEKSSISVDTNRVDYYGGNDYSNKIDKSLSDVCITSSNSNGYYNFKIFGTNIFVDENYDMNIFVYNECK